MNSSNRSKMCAACALTVLAPLLLAADKPVVITKEQMDQAIMESVGGNIVKPGSGRGNVCVINAQKRVGEEKINEHLDGFRAKFDITIDCKTGALTGLPTAKTLKADGATIGIYVVDRDKDGDTLLIAPEGRWGLIDVASLAKDNPTPPRLLNRVQKELTRAFALLCGCADSQYRGMVTGPVRTLTDLDRITFTELPIDCYQKIEPYLHGMRIEPRIVRTYMDACQEGWAPQPTNKWQKAIWDKVHETPTKPIQIKFDPKRDAGK